MTDYQYFSEEHHDYCIICGELIIHRNGKKLTLNPECECETEDEWHERLQEEAIK